MPTYRDGRTVTDEPNRQVNDRVLEIVERLTRLVVSKVELRRQVSVRAGLQRRGNNLKSARKQFKRFAARQRLRGGRSREQSEDGHHERGETRPAPARRASDRNHVSWLPAPLPVVAGSLGSLLTLGPRLHASAVTRAPTRRTPENLGCDLRLDVRQRLQEVAGAVNVKLDGVASLGRLVGVEQVSPSHSTGAAATGSRRRRGHHKCHPRFDIGRHQLRVVAKNTSSRSRGPEQGNDATVRTGGDQADAALDVRATVDALLTPLINIGGRRTVRPFFARALGGTSPF